MSDDLVQRLLYLTEDLHNRGELDYSDLTSRAKARIETLEAALQEIVERKFIDCGCYSIACEALGVECKI